MIRRRLTSALAGLLLVGALASTPPVAAAPTPLEDPPAPDRGRWSVAASGPDSWTVTWRAPQRLPIGTDRPTVVAAEQLGELAPGTELGVPTVAEDGRTVEVTVTSTVEPSPADLDVVLSGEVLDEGISPDPGGPGTERWETPDQTLLGVDPGTKGPLPTTSSDYTLPGIEVPGMAKKVEMKGHVVEPSAADPSHPLVLFLHGRHSYCYNPETGRQGWRWPCRGAQEPIPSQLGYDYIQRVLASHGYVTVSIAANGINAQDGSLPDGGAAARSQLVQAHLDQWDTWADEAEPTYEADLSNVVLVGHSRGGEGVSRASLEIPLAAPYRVVGQVLIGPTNFGRQTTPYVPTVTVLPSCDGDVIDLQGQSYTDIARGLATGDTAMKSSVMAIGANHNFFNTEWTPGLAAAPAWDDWGAREGVCGKGAETRLTGAEQRAVGKAYVAGAVRLFADGDEAFRPMFDGSATRVGSTGDAVVLSHMVGGDRELRLPGTGTGTTVPSNATTLICQGETPWGRTAEPLCGKFARVSEATPHWPVADSLIPTSDAFQMSWKVTEAVGGLELDSPLDLTGRDSLDLRTVVDPRIGDVSVRLRLTDTQGVSEDVVPVGGGDLPALPTDGREGMLGKYWAQTLRAAVADLDEVDVSSISRIEIVGTSDAGRLWVLDVAAVTAALPEVPSERVPIVDLGRVRVDEGDGGTGVAEVPMTVTGTVGVPAEFWVYGWDQEQEEAVSIEVELPPGSDDGVITWEYDADTRDDPRRMVQDVVGHAIRDVMLRDNQGRVVIVDDD